jgi:hypothetical protein
VNGLAFNGIAWATVVIVGLLTIISTIQTIVSGNTAGS